MDANVYDIRNNDNHSPFYVGSARHDPNLLNKELCFVGPIVLLLCFEYSS